MPKKIYKMHGTATDSQGQKHIVTMIGRFETLKEERVVEDDVDVLLTPTKSTKGTIYYPVKRPIRKLTYAYSICHPEDTYDEAVGESIATRRLDTDPMGELTSKYVTCLCKDQIELILFGELKFVMANIDRFTSKQH